MIGNYKYSPEDYRDMLSMAEDLTLFYELFETYSENRTQDNLFALERQGRELFFTIKHRAYVSPIPEKNTSNKPLRSGMSKSFALR